MTILKKTAESKKPVAESAQDRANAHKIGAKLCENFISQAYKSNGDVVSLRDSIAGLLDGCNETLLKYVDDNRFKSGSARDAISRMSVALDDSFTEIQKVRS